MDESGLTKFNEEQIAALDRVVKLLLVMAPTDEDYLRCIPSPRAQDSYLWRLEVAIKNRLILDAGISAEVAPTLAKSYCRALVFRIASSSRSPIT